MINKSANWGFISLDIGVTHRKNILKYLFFESSDVKQDRLEFGEICYTDKM